MKASYCHLTALAFANWFVRLSPVLIKLKIQNDNLQFWKQPQQQQNEQTEVISSSSGTLYRPESLESTRGTMKIIPLVAQHIILWIKVTSHSQIPNSNFLCTSTKLSEVLLTKKRQERRDTNIQVLKLKFQSWLKISTDTLFKGVFLKVEGFEENGHSTL